MHYQKPSRTSAVLRSRPASQGEMHALARYGSRTCMYSRPSPHPRPSSYKDQQGRRLQIILLFPYQTQYRFRSPQLIYPLSPPNWLGCSSHSLSVARTTVFNNTPLLFIFPLRNFELHRRQLDTALFSSSALLTYNATP